MSVPTPSCPNCGTAWPPDVTVCPHCGYVRPGVPAWPPPPTGVRPLPPPPVPKLVTGKVWGDVMLGFIISLGANFVYCLGLLVMPILYFTLRPNYPAFARGLGFGTLAGLILLLGAFVWCFGGIPGFHG